MSLDKKNFPLREPEYAEAPPEYSQSSTAGPSFPSAPPLEATYDENSFSTIQQQGLGSASKLTNNSTNYDGYQLPTLAAPQQQGNFYQQHQQQQQPPSQQQSVRQYGVAPGLRTGGFGGGSKDIIVEMVPLNNNEYTPPTEDACIAALIGIKAAYAKAYFFWTQYFDEEDGAVRGEDFHETALIHLGKKKCKTQHFYNLPPPKFVDAVMFAQWVKEGKIVF